MKRDAGGRELAGFFDLLERVGPVRLPRRVVTEATSEDAYAALLAARLVEAAACEKTAPCPHRADCAREVRDTWDDDTRPRSPDEGDRRFLALCGQHPVECEPEWLAAREVEAVSLALPALVKIVRALFGLRVVRGTDGALGERSARSEPLPIGTQERGAFASRAGRDTARDAFLSLRPAEEASAPWLALRERAPAGAVVFVPTVRRMNAELVARHGAMDRVEIVPLEDAVTLKGGAIALSARGLGLRVVTAAQAEAANASDDDDTDPLLEPRTRRNPLRKTRGLELPPVTRWPDLTVCLIDGETVRFDGAGKYVRCSFQDLGFASTKNRKATRPWGVLTGMCVSAGQFEWKRFDHRWEVARRQVADLSKRLRELFGIDESPFEEMSGGTYRAKFRAREGVPETSC